MKNLLTNPLLQIAFFATSVGGMLAWSGQHNTLEASSHREAPRIADDPLADNTDVYAFRSPDAPANDANATVTIIADYIPFELPQGGPTYYTFGENIQYDIHVKNNPTTTGDDIIYRFTFTRTNEDPSTFFRVRLGKENLRTFYSLDEIRGGATTRLLSSVPVPAPNIGPRSIESPVGLNQTNGYAAYQRRHIQQLGNGMKVFCGQTDDPFFTDIGAIFDLGSVRGRGKARDGLARFNTHAIAMQIPVRLLARTGANLTAATNILDSNYIIGVWASANRQALRTIVNGSDVQSGNFVQVSRLGMPLTNEVIQPIGLKDEWNSATPFGTPLPAAGSQQFRFDENLMNPELGLYVADNTPRNGAAPKPAGQTYFGEAVPGLSPLRVQTRSLAGLLPSVPNGFDFRNGANGLAGLAGSSAVAGTALAPIAAGGFGEFLLRPGKPRSVDLLPLFHTGVPNLIPYQLATGKNGNPLAAGKPFINNFLPTFGDMLRLNMAVPPTPRNSPDFSSEGLLAAAVLGLTDPRFNSSAALQFIPNMDGFPNGRRLEDDVTRIELQAVGGVVLAAIGLWYDDYVVGRSPSPLTPQLLRVLNFTTNVEQNDKAFRGAFPYLPIPWNGLEGGDIARRNPGYLGNGNGAGGLNMQPSLIVVNCYPNPFADRTTFFFNLAFATNVTIVVTDVISGHQVATVVAGTSCAAGTNQVVWQPGNNVRPGQYNVTLYSGNTALASVRIERQ
ncbi:hypothetical protein AUC43_08145 [Hymenobacter sedentarius]|uniref:DUF4331 domain-containing protein n=1 Tax=Hymenobacter sedentarius TaxID=1411621 RepID=A0A0U4C4C7_9BACT|nr:DUF4331 domain-containing protein [Hymenobacter sedentarius]ALW85064.1 hypothetical protein AUC43_08145 [Hymenobacter sedentarius]